MKSTFLLNIRLVRKDKSANDCQVKLLEATTTFGQDSELEAIQLKLNCSDSVITKDPNDAEMMISILS